MHGAAREDQKTRIYLCCPRLEDQHALLSQSDQFPSRNRGEELMGLGFGTEVWTVHLPRTVAPFDRDYCIRDRLAGSYLRITPTRIRAKLRDLF